MQAGELATRPTLRFRLDCSPGELLRHADVTLAGQWRVTARHAGPMGALCRESLGIPLSGVDLSRIPTWINASVAARSETGESGALRRAPPRPCPQPDPVVEAMTASGSTRPLWPSNRTPCLGGGLDATPKTLAAAVSAVPC